MVKHAARSDRGMLRELNEDSFNVLDGSSREPVSFIIADGMGGHNSGEVASKMAVDLITSDLLQASGYIDKDRPDITDKLKDIVTSTNEKIYEASLREESNMGMGTTLTMAVVHEDKLFIGHIGDSRLYIIRDGAMKQLTTDHTFVDELVRSGSLTNEEAATHPKKNLLTRALGCSGSLEVDVFECSIKNNDVFLMCTDGLTNSLTENEIMETVVAGEDLQTACDKLISKANGNGGEDNITVILFKREDNEKWQ